VPRPTAYAGFLRAVNVGHRKVGMDDLRRAVLASGGSEVRTVLNSGNVVFRAEAADPGRLERALDQDCSARLGLPVEFLLRDLPSLDAAIAGNPFNAFAREDPSHLLVYFLKAAPPPKLSAALVAGLEGPEEARVVDAHAYVTYPAGIGTSRLTLPRIEAAIGTRATGRNWNTVLRVAALARGLTAEGGAGG
jgi:uncharacterized protein (DUF1697 family)